MPGHDHPTRKGTRKIAVTGRLTKYQPKPRPARTKAIPTRMLATRSPNTTLKPSIPMDLSVCSPRTRRIDAANPSHAIAAATSDHGSRNARMVPAIAVLPSAVASAATGTSHHQELAGAKPPSVYD